MEENRQASLCIVTATLDMDIMKLIVVVYEAYP